MEDITLSWDRRRSVEREDGCGIVDGDCEIVSDEHCAVGEEVKAVVADGEGMSGCVGGRGLALPVRAFACCSHISRVLGSTGQLGVES